MSRPFTSKAILKAVGSAKLSLYYVTGHGYWVFAYDDIAGRNVYDTESVYVPRLNSMSFDRWVEQGKDFLNKMENEQ